VKNNNDNPSVTESATAERRQFFRQATAIGVGTAISSLPLASGAQTQDSFVLATVQLSIKPGKLDALCKEVFEVALKDTRRFDGLISLEVYAEQGADTLLLLEKWKSKAHHEKYREWRKTSGFGAIVGPYVTGPSAIRYFDPRPE
jgi:quinol monooxygenase YgiN